MLQELNFLAINGVASYTESPSKQDNHKVICIVLTTNFKTFKYIPGVPKKILRFDP